MLPSPFAHTQHSIPNNLASLIDMGPVTLVGSITSWAPGLAILVFTLLYTILHSGVTGSGLAAGEVVFIKFMKMLHLFYAGHEVAFMNPMKKMLSS